MDCFKYFIIKVCFKGKRVLTINIEDSTIIFTARHLILYNLNADNDVYRYTNNIYIFVINR